MEEKLIISGAPIAARLLRTFCDPLDATAVLYSVGELTLYAKNETLGFAPYPGLLVAVLSEDKSEADFYKLTKDTTNTADGVHCKFEKLDSSKEIYEKIKTDDWTIAGNWTFNKDISAGGATIGGTIETADLVVSNGIYSQDSVEGGFAQGFIAKKLENGSWSLSIDSLIVRKTFQAPELIIDRAKYLGGKIYITRGGGIICSGVEEAADYYRCYFENKDADGRTITCTFETGDDALCLTFNETDHRYYWRRVTGIGENYIDLSKTVYDTSVTNSIPQVGDEIVLFGSTIESRQNAIVLDAVSNGGGYIQVVDGVTNYVIPTPSIDLNPTLSTIKAKFISTTTGLDFDDSVDSLKLDINSIKTLVDKEFTIWFYEYTPTLSNLPASDWNTESLKQTHLQDLFYDRKSGNAYRFEQDDAGGYYWEIVTDAETVRALEKANTAQDTADSKRRVFVSLPTDSDAYDVGDQWVNATYGDLYENDALVCVTAKAKGAAFSISHWKSSSTATTAYLENLGDLIVLAVTDSNKGIEEAKLLANQGISDAASAAAGATNALTKANSAYDLANVANVAATKNTTIIQQTNESIAALANRFSFDSEGNIINISKSGLVTTADFNTLLTDRVSFDSDGNVTNISTSGLVTTADFAGLFSEQVVEGELVARAEISAFITEDEAGNLISNAVIDADNINFVGKTIINGSFVVDNSGNLSLHDASINISDGAIELNLDGSGQLALGNIKWDTLGNTTFSGSIARPIKVLDYASYVTLDFNTGFDFNLRNFGKGEEIYLPSSNIYEGVECNLFEGHVKVSSGYSPATIRTTESTGFVLNASETANEATVTPYIKLRVGRMVKLKAITLSDDGSAKTYWYVENPEAVIINTGGSGGSGGSGNGEVDYSDKLVENKVDIAFLARMFSLFDTNGNLISMNDLVTTAASIKANYGLWTDEFLSAKGQSN